MGKRKVDIVVISDIHLGTYGCHADELVDYLKSVKPKILILNGDIIDIWNFRKSYWPKSHMEVLKQIFKKAAQGIPIYYITGNHDDLLRRFSDFTLGNFHLVDKLVLDLNGKKAWFFHGDVFDASIVQTRWLAKIGGQGYDILILINRTINLLLQFLGRPKMSLSDKVRKSVKRAVKFVCDYEKTAAFHAIEKGYDYVACGHIHQAQISEVHSDKGSVTYLNSGDWVESLTALEYKDGDWSIFKFEDVMLTKKELDSEKILEAIEAQKIRFPSIETASVSQYSKLTGE